MPQSPGVHDAVGYKPYEGYLSENDWLPCVGMLEEFKERAYENGLGNWCDYSYNGNLA